MSRWILNICRPLCEPFSIKRENVITNKNILLIMMQLQRIFYCIILISHIGACSTKQDFLYVGTDNNDLVLLLAREGNKMISCQTISEALDAAPYGGHVLLLAKDYPEKIGQLHKNELEKINKKDLKVYLEYYLIGDTDTFPTPKAMSLERVVVTDTAFFQDLPYMSLLTINGSYVLPLESKNPLLVTAKVAGFDKAEYGLNDTESMPLLFHLDSNILVATAPLSCFASARFSPETSWKKVWESILPAMSKRKMTLESWISYVQPSYQQTTRLPNNARKKSIENGIEWFYNGHFLIDKSWKAEWVDKYMGDGSNPVGPELPKDLKNGDGTLGVLEGHCSFIDYDGSQKYRYWLRNDVQGESAMAFSLAGKLLDRQDYLEVAHNLNDFSFDQFRQGARNNPASPSFGLLSWAVTHPGIYYGDDNARSVLGSLTSASILNDKQWNRKILECITGNFKTTGKKGFRGDRLKEEDIQKNGWEYYFNRELINPHPHFEAWMWACYLWLYAKTGYQPLFERSREGIRITMEAYPDGWKWTNGIQQEKARMILPLAWLVRVAPTEEHIQWLNFMVDELLKNQVTCGAIREELGDPSTGRYGKIKSNSEYGKNEAPLISSNGDPVADMLYTNNFAFIGLNEAAKVTGDPKHIEALNRLSDFLTRIQVESDRFKSIDGAWFRAFNYENWDYWASNADAGWGAWSTLTGWIQSWIVSTQVLMELDTSLWEITRNLPIEEEWQIVKKSMLKD